LGADWASFAEGEITFDWKELGATVPSARSGPVLWPRNAMAHNVSVRENPNCRFDIFMTSYPPLEKADTVRPHQQNRPTATPGRQGGLSQSSNSIYACVSVAGWPSCAPCSMSATSRRTRRRNQKVANTFANHVFDTHCEPASSVVGSIPRLGKNVACLQSCERDVPKSPGEPQPTCHRQAINPKPEGAFARQRGALASFWRALGARRFFARGHSTAS
jgi:hypothetical protein